MDLSRRQMLLAPAALAFGTQNPEPRTHNPEPGTLNPLPDAFPRQAVEMVQEMVFVSHGNVKRVRELVDAHPALARAAMDWGFGDWEDALGAASHVGNREIAEHLIANGARPTIFSAAMLGHLETVKAFVAAQPGVQRIAGPHSISLLSHARAGGAAAVKVLDYLEQLGDAGGPETKPISDEEKTALAGAFEHDITIAVDKGLLTFNRKGMPYPRGLHHAGNREFFPMGAAAVRIAFAGSSLTIRDGSIVVSAARIG